MKKLGIQKKQDINLLDPDRLVDISGNPSIYSDEDRGGHRVLVERRNAGEFVGKALYLSANFNWVIGVDSEGHSILVPLRKER